MKKWKFNKKWIIINYFKTENIFLALGKRSKSKATKKTQHKQDITKKTVPIYI